MKGKVKVVRKAKVEDVKKEDFDFDISILSIDDLDLAVGNQSSLYYYYADRAAKASQIADYKALELSEIEARIKQELRADTRVKHTENSLTEWVILTPEYKQAKLAYLQAKHDAERKGVVEKALRQRKSMIEKAVELHLVSAKAEVKQPLSQYERDVIVRKKGVK